MDRTWIDGREAVVISCDDPSIYTRSRQVYIGADRGLYLFVVRAMGRSYYDLVNSAYSTLVENLRIR